MTLNNEYKVASFIVNQLEKILQQQFIGKLCLFIQAKH